MSSSPKKLTPTEGSTFTYYSAPVGSWTYGTRDTSTSWDTTPTVRPLETNEPGWSTSKRRILTPLNTDQLPKRSRGETPWAPNPKRTSSPQFKTSPHVTGSSIMTESVTSPTSDIMNQRLTSQLTRPSTPLPTCNCGYNRDLRVRDQRVSLLKALVELERLSGHDL